MSDPIKVCLVGLNNLPVLAKEFSSNNFGGPAVQQTILARILARRGFQISMVVADLGQHDGATWDGITTYKAYDPNSGIAGLRFFHPRWTGVWSALRRANADVYFFYCADMLLGQLTMFARRYRRKVVFQVASDTDCDPRKVRLGSWRHRSLYHYGLRQADAILAQTTEQQQALMANYGRTSHLAKALSDDGGHTLECSQRDISVLWVSNIRQLKRPDLALELARQLPHLTIHMAGGPMTGVQALYDDVLERAAQTPNVQFLGPVPYLEVNEYFRRARVFINTSDIEGFPNTYLQAWRRGTPVVAFLDPDRLIEREGLGCVVTSLDEMKRCVHELATNNKLWQTTSERCKAFVSREFSEDTALAPYVSVIESLAGRPAPHSWHL